ncbi:hypothetical protein FQ192_10265 [Pseudomonas sp. ANT_J12]|uniref:hypothetical protein n=1 Tax=Pseudomonas sp. ANT_J12 TaxID=2597351 RepID=UPI0011F2DD84|nr:hypothetical protein [Pseudomonas sp. ANT_J12]KAA0995423.1 hypothetical protein FQ192_10265 [Pseudomonas sp. ANT_J12]
MSFFSRFKALARPAPKEQVVGYSRDELKVVFSEPLARLTADSPPAVSLENIDVPAYYCSFLIDKEDAHHFWALVESAFSYETQKPFNDALVKQYASTEKNHRLLCLTSDEAFNSTTVRLVTNSLDFLDSIRRERFAVPPPWVAFEGYNPAWWGGAMQGMNGYYNDSYFLPFFTGLSTAEKHDYFARYAATDEWISQLELMYGDE